VYNVARVIAPELSTMDTCLLQVYFRYYRFFPDGSLLYRTSPLNIAKVVRSFRPGATTGPGVHVSSLASADVFAGRYMMKDNQVRSQVVCWQVHSSLLCCCLCTL
jgi:hypothetical protein